jgi:plastocyanin
MTIRTRSIAIGAISAIALAGAAGPALAQKTITLTTTKSSPMAFTGAPKTLKAGTYTFKYVNSSGIAHNLRVGSTATPLITTGSKTIKVTLKKGTTVKYVCDPHSTMMKGTIKVT